MSYFGETFSSSLFVFGIGCDVFNMQRIRDLDEKKRDLLAQKILSNAEIEEYGKSADKTRFLAVRFSVKESISKAFKTGLRGFSMRDITIMKTPLGAPYVILSPITEKIAGDNGIKNIEISISHDGDTVFTTAVALK